MKPAEHYRKAKELLAQAEKRTQIRSLGADDE